MLKALTFLLISIALVSSISYSYYSSVSYKIGDSPPNKVILEIYSSVNNPANITFNNFTQEIYIKTPYNLTGNISLIHINIPNCPISNHCYIINDAYLTDYNSIFLIQIINGTKEKLGCIKIIVCGPENLSIHVPISSNTHLPQGDSKDDTPKYDYIVILLIPILSIIGSILLRTIKRNK
ncbi:hypothetical protein [Acidianus sp. HS-5]|uniref:hypothetical protein n=1 Tax=Acidianus sp. HS-5 TaxID=2886040 RepID=UPI001F3BA3BF|nr:hypothetical protein [Acidianus sp. HS-5]BDC19208.1 hypothetical protein HS5_20980 [Acidianus sp. HS-5]